MRIILLFFCLSPIFLFSQRPSVFDSLMLAYSDTVYFESGKWDITSEADSVIRLFAGKTTSNQSKIYLTGHTDDIGSVAFNENLAIKRANAIVAYLADQGVDTTQYITQTFGERQPAAANVSDQNRRRNRRVTLDVFSPSAYVKVVGTIKNHENEEGIEATIRLHNRSFSDTLMAEKNGHFEIYLPVDSVIAMDVYAPGHFYKSQFFKVKRTGMAPIILTLPKAVAGASIDIPNLYFYGSKDVLLPRSAPELPKLQRFIELNPRIQIEIAGHINYPNRAPVSPDTFEWDLAERRAKRIYDWLLDAGVSESQITHKGYGNHEMRFPRAISERDQELNRRVEIRVLGTGEVISIEEEK